MDSSIFSEVLKTVEEGRHLGSRTLPDGTQLIGHVPHFAPEGYLHELFPGLSEGEIAAMERDPMIREIPEDYRQFLSRCNGAFFFCCSLWLGGRRRNYARSGDEARQPFSLGDYNGLSRPRDARDGEFFVGGYRDRDGSLLYLRNGRAFRCSRKSVEPVYEWGGFWEMLGAEIARLSQLFDATGRMKVPRGPFAP